MAKRGPSIRFWLLLSVCLLSPHICWAEFPTKYDAQIRSSIKEWWPDLPEWKLGKAQLIAESNLDPNICSSANACGLAQFLGPVWADMAKALAFGVGISRFDANASTQAYAYYMARLRWQWRRNRTPLEAHWPAVASYNRGIGNIIKDQTECSGARLWPQIEPCTAKHTMETVSYIKRIVDIWHRLAVD